MSFRHETSQLARELARLAHSGASRTLDRDGLAVALVARRDTLQLLRQVLHDLAGRAGPVTAAKVVSFIREEHSIQEAERRPVQMLTRMLTASPQPTLQPAPEFTQASSAVSEGEQGWANVRRHALLAEHEWADRRPVPVGDQQWSAVADVSALARTIAVLDHDLVEAARRIHPDIDPSVIRDLTVATTSGLRMAATEAGTMATAGPLPEWTEPGPERNATRVLAVTTPASVVAAQKRLPAQILDAAHLSPQAIVRIADGQARFLDAAARALTAHDPGRAEAARSLAQSLRANVTGARQLASLMPDDPRPFEQTRSLLVRIAAVESKGWDHPSSHAFQPAMAAGVDASRTVLRALDIYASNAVRSGQWLVPNIHAEDAKDPLWRRARPKEWEHHHHGRRELETEPKLLRGLSALTARADALPRPQSPAAAAVPPRVLLAEVVSPSLRVRPFTPTQATATPGRG